MKNQKLLYVSIILLITHSGYPATPESINKHGIQLGQEKMFREAINEFDRAIEKINKSSAEIYHNKGWTFEQMGNIKEAIPNYEEAFRRYPKQIVTGERLGFLYFKTGDFINAVRVGEYVIKLDTKNQEVRKWLPDAYLNKLKQEQEQFDALKKKEDEEKKQKQEQIIKEKEEQVKYSQKFYGTFDFIIRNGYYFRGKDKGYKYVKDNGLIIDVPESLYMSITPVPSWEFDISIENPYLGAISPNLTINTEKFEVLNKLGDFSLGIGFLFNHYIGNIAFDGSYGNDKLWDYKTGILFGYKKDKGEMKFSIYPRLLPYDGSASSRRTLDVDLFEINYTYTVDSTLKYYSIISARDYYFFNHKTVISDYWGLYQIGIGVTLGKISSETNKVNIAFSIEFRELFYLMDLNNKNPYTKKPNGQGYFGMNSSKWLKGDPFSGYRSTSHQFSIRIDERTSKNFFLYQKVIIEMASQNENHNEFNLQLGVGAVF